MPPTQHPSLPHSPLHSPETPLPPPPTDQERSVETPGDSLRRSAAFPWDPSLGSYLTATVPGIGGTIKQRPEDFLVEELPLYEPCGAGEHLYLFVEKTGLSTSHLASIIASHFSVNRGAIGFAGLKDKVAVTRQTISVHVPGKSGRDFPPLEHPRIKVLWIDLHANKLRRGHLAGNRFSVRIRGVEASAVVRAARVLRDLESRGVPNRIGVQRFGLLRNNHLIGRALLQRDARAALDVLLGVSEEFPTVQAAARSLYQAGRYAEAMEGMPRHTIAERNTLRALARGKKPHQALWAIDSLQRSFFITAFQSAVFNAVLADRLRSGSFDRLVEGDVAFKHEGRGIFAVDSAVLQSPDTPERLATFQISPSGPMWAADTVRATGDVAAAELAALSVTGVTTEMLDGYAERNRDSINGERRPLRVPISNIQVEGGADEHGSYVRCVFDLPRGSFATTVLDEIMKTPPRTPFGEVGADEPEEDES